MTNPAGSPIDAMGEITAHDPSSNTDALTWDDLGRLITVARRDSSNNGFNFGATYDPLGRRIGTSTQQVVAGANSGTAVPTNSLYDPEAEFQEVYNVAGTQARWLVHGPDLNEEYGGLNGTGGVEAVVNIGTSTTGMMSDAFGNVVATGSGSTTNWNAVRSLGYGPQPGTTAQALDATHDVSTALAWRGRYIDPTGFYNLGARTYDPASGTFLSCDPLGHAASMDLYSYCNGDPINGFDADGRIATRIATRFMKYEGRQYEAEELTAQANALGQQAIAQQIDSVLPQSWQTPAVEGGTVFFLYSFEEWASTRNIRGGMSPSSNASLLQRTRISRFTSLGAISELHRPTIAPELPRRNKRQK